MVLNAKGPQIAFSRAVTWAFAMKLGRRGVLAAVTFVLAVLLTPEDFGVVAIAMVYIAFARMLVDQGLTAALIQREDLKEGHLDSVFWLVLSVSAGLTILTWLAADWYAALNDVPLLGIVLIVLSISIPIEGLTVVQKAILQKELDFKKLALRDNLSAVVGGALGIWSAFWGFGVWALVIQKIATDFTALALLWGVTRWRPRFQFHWRSLRELLSFSTANLIAKFGVFASLRTDIFLMGIFFGPLAVGLYRIADRISEMVVDLPTGSLQVASYPEFSRRQSDYEALRRRLLSVVKFSSCIALPLLLLIAGLSQDLLALIGEQWLPAAGTLSLLCVSYVFLIPTYFTGPLFQAVGRPIILAGITWVQIAVNIVLLVGLGLLLRDANAATQTMGIAAIRAFTSSVLLLISVVIVKQMIGLPPLRMIRTQLPALASGLLGFATVWLLAGQISDNPLVELLVRSGFGVLVSAVVLFLLESEVRSMLSVLKSEALRFSQNGFARQQR